MKKDEHISEEQLNAFLDGELDSEEISCLFDQAEQSAELDQRLCQQRKLKELVKHAYRDVPEPRRILTGSSSPRNLVGLAMVATLLLAFGFATGLFIDGLPGQSTPANKFAAGGNILPIASTENFILHVTSGEPMEMKLALQKARELLDAAEPGQPRKVEFVANERGLDLLRSDVSLFTDEIRALSSENVAFYACSKAIQRLEEKGIKVQLVPEAIPGYTALDRVVERMQDGWEYIKI